MKAFASHPFRLLTVILIVMAAVEAATRFGFSRISRIEKRIASEYAAAVSIRRQPGRTNLLLVGNSLLLEGINADLLSRRVPREVHITRFAVEQTYYLDWEYGLRRLFREGSQPDLVVLLLGPTHMLSSQIRGDYSAYYLFDARDIPDIGNRLGYTLNQTSSLLFAHGSLFYAGRNNLRNFILGQVDPPYAAFLHALPAASGPSLPPAAAQSLAAQRFAVLQDMATAHHAALVFVSAPGFFPAAESEVLAGARQASVSALAPAPNGSWPAKRFRDGFHLTPVAADSFTAELADQLSPFLANPVSH
jgi:hypothetical protein